MLYFKSYPEKDEEKAKVWQEKKKLGKSYCSLKRDFVLKYCPLLSRQTWMREMELRIWDSERGDGIWDSGRGEGIWDSGRGDGRWYW